MSGLADMPGIDTNVVSNCLTIPPFFILVGQRKHKVVEEKRVAFDEEVEKFSDAGFIT